MEEDENGDNAIEMEPKIIAPEKGYSLPKNRARVLAQALNCFGTMRTLFLDIDQWFRRCQHGRLASVQSDRATESLVPDSCPCPFVSIFCEIFIAASTKMFPVRFLTSFSVERTSSTDKNQRTKAVLLMERQALVQPVIFSQVW